jgi:hypothetical protein
VASGAATLLLSSFNWSLSRLAHSFPNRRINYVDHPIHELATGRRAWQLRVVKLSLPSRNAQVTAQRKRCVSQWVSFVLSPANTSWSTDLAASSAPSASSSESESYLLSSAAAIPDTMRPKWTDASATETREFTGGALNEKVVL